MTKLLRQALEAVQKLRPESQDEIARAMLTLARWWGGAGADRSGFGAGTTAAICQWCRGWSSVSPLRPKKPRFTRRAVDISPSLPTISALAILRPRKPSVLRSMTAWQTSSCFLMWGSYRQPKVFVSSWLGSTCTWSTTLLMKQLRRSLSSAWSTVPASAIMP